VGKTDDTTANGERPTTSGQRPLLEILHERISDVGAVVVGDSRGRALDFFHKTVEIFARIGDADHADRGAIPKAGSIQLGNRNVEAGAQPVFQAAYDLAPIFERLRSFNVEFEGEKGNHDGR